MSYLSFFDARTRKKKLLTRKFTSKHGKCKFKSSYKTLYGIWQKLYEIFHQKLYKCWISYNLIQWLQTFSDSRHFLFANIWKASSQSHLLGKCSVFMPFPCKQLDTNQKKKVFKSRLIKMTVKTFNSTLANDFIIANYHSFFWTLNPLLGEVSVNC